MSWCVVTHTLKMNSIFLIKLDWICIHRIASNHDDVIKWKHFPRYWPYVRGIHQSPMNSHHKGQWSGALMFSLICVWTNGWSNHRDAGDLRRHCAHYGVTVMLCGTLCPKLWTIMSLRYWMGYSFAAVSFIVVSLLMRPRLYVWYPRKCVNRTLLFKPNSDRGRIFLGDD